MENNNTQLPQKFQKTLLKDEQIQWVGRPNFGLYILGSIFGAFFGLFWLALFPAIFYISSIRPDFQSNCTVNGSACSGEVSGTVQFYSLSILLILGVIFILIQLFAYIKYNNIRFVITNKRMFKVEGIFGLDQKSLYFEKISDMDVKINPVQNIFQLGTLMVTPIGSQFGIRFNDIQKPYEVLDILEKVKPVK